ncbi:MAG: alpha-amylase family glycosyl hydrolase [Candidatus Promineifilaceae bacterium]
MSTHTPSWRELVYRLRGAFLSTLGRSAPSELPGMGAVPAEAGTTFRVWAPNAKRVTVTGSFNAWSREHDPLTAEGNGYWSGHVAEAGEGDIYKYVIHGNPSRLYRADPYAREIAYGPNSGNGDSIIRHLAVRPREQASPPWLPSWNEMVIYELHTGTFSGAVPGRPGTFDAAIERLPYLAELGVNVIELMPVATFAGDYSWGYNPAHPFAVEAAYGGPEGLWRLVEAAHAQGIAVFLDVVYNHFGPQDLDLWQFDGWRENSKGGIYFYNDWRSSTPWGDTRPDYGRAEVRQYIRDNALMWLESYGVDGLRWDMTNFIRHAHGHDHDPGAAIPEGWDMLRWINDEIDARWPWRVSIAEDLQGNALVTRPTSEGGGGFDAQWDALFFEPVRAAIIGGEDDQRDLSSVAAALSHRYDDDAFHRVIYTESHDEVANGKARVPEEIAPGDAGSLFARRRSVLGAALVFTAAGIPMIFQGQEFLEDGWFDDRVALDWQKREKYAGIVDLYHDLIHLRRNLGGQTRGLTGQHTAVTHLDYEQKLIAFHRWEFGGADDDVLVIANFANRTHESMPVPFPHDGDWRLLFNSDDRRYDPDFTGTPAADITAAGGQAAVAIGPYSVLIYSRAG